MKNISLFIGVGLFCIFVFSYIKRPIFQECDYFLEQPLRILTASSIHPYCQYVILMNIFLIITILAGSGFVIYWLIIGRKKSPHLFIMTAKRKKTQVKSKMILVVIVAVVGVGSMITGITIFFTEPNVIYHDQHNEEFVLPNQQKGNINIDFHALNGLMPFRGIDTGIKVSFPEKITNSSIVEVKFPEAEVIIKDEISGRSTVGKIISLNYLESNGESSTYSKELWMIYNNPDKYVATLKIVNNDIIFDEKIESVITIGSWNEYLAAQANYQTQGLAWLIFGISLISTASVFTKFIDLYYKFFELKRKEFYE